MAWQDVLNIAGLWNGGAPVPVDVSNPLPVVASSEGAFGYVSATGMTTGNLPFGAGKTVKALRVLAVGADASFNLNGGATITLRQYTGFDLSPRTALSGQLNWVSGTLDVFAEVA